MLISSLGHPKDVGDLVSLASKPNMELVHATREAINTQKCAALLHKNSNVLLHQQVAKQLKDSARQVELDARKLACRLGIPVNANKPFTPMMVSEQGISFLFCLFSRPPLNISNSFIYKNVELEQCLSVCINMFISFDRCCTFLLAWSFCWGLFQL
jgi:hypothetical protein